MKTAIVYYSQSGNTEYVAKACARLLGADLIPIAPVKEYPSTGFKKFLWGGKSAVMGEAPRLENYAFDAEAYEGIILGCPVWAGTFAPPLRTFIEENREGLRDKRIAAFACCSGGPGKVMEKLKKLLSLEALAGELILIDPKDKPAEQNEARIKAFCDAMR